MARNANGELVAAIDCELRAWNLRTNPPDLAGRKSETDVLGRPSRYASLAMNGTAVGWAVTVLSELRSFRVQSPDIEIINRWKVRGGGNSRLCRIDPTRRRLAIGKADG